MKRSVEISLKASSSVKLDRSVTLSQLPDKKLQDRALKILETLNYYYPDPPIPLDHTNDFTFLVAVVLSAQTTDGKVNQVTKELFKIADSPEKMAVLDVSLVQSIIQPVGLAPRKAQYVVGLSKALLEKHNGLVPSSYEELEALPGVGHKTASVIMSQLFGEQAIAVDTHVHRLALRWGLSKEEKNVEKVQKDLCRVFPKEFWNKVSELVQYEMKRKELID
jgi:endonuclease-3